MPMLQSKLCIEEGIPLKKYSTFGIGGPAAYFSTVETVEDLIEAQKWAQENSKKIFILGKGSNCLFDDRGFNGLVILNKIDFIEGEGPLFKVGSGYNFSRLGSLTARKGWSGLEFASGIPGTVGGAVYMNAGANGTETSKHLVSVQFLDQNGKIHEYAKEELTFRYRYSSFHDLKGAITAATFSLISSPIAREKQLAIIGYRTSTQPYGMKSAGCIFRNPKGGGAGALIEQAGLKGTRIGDAEVSALHANFIVNHGEAKAQDVLELVSYVKKRVKEKTGADLEMEVRLIPYES